MKISKKIKQFTYKGFVITSCVMVLMNQFLFMLPQQKGFQVQAATNSIDTQTEWQAGTYEYNEIDTATSAGDIKLQLDLGSWDAASSPAQFNHYVGAGGATVANTKIVKVGKFVYVFRNRAVGAFLRYDLSTREWKEMAYIPIQPYEVIDATTNGVDTIWAFATRSGRKHFLAYDIPSNSWSFKDNTPLAIVQGATLEYVSGTTNYVYALQGGGTGFWRYNIALNQWSSQLTTTATCNLYCDLAYDGSRYLYLASNNYNPDRFLKIDTTATSPTWSTVANFPLDTSVNYGSDLVMVGTDFYMMRTGTVYPGTQTMYKYNGSSWSTVKNVPFTGAYGSMTYDSEENRIIVFGGVGEMVYYYPTTNTYSNQSEGPPANAYATGSNLVSDGAGNLFLCRANGSSTCYRYDMPQNTWYSTMSATLATLGNEGTSLVSTGSGSFYAARGSLGNTFYYYDLRNNGWVAKATSTGILGAGSAMIASGSAAIFALQGGNAAGFYRYDTAANTWAAKTNIPEVVHRGGGLVQAANGAFQYIYAMVGGNRGKFYRYHETTNGWYELPSLPVGSYYGGGLTYDGTNYIYALVGGENTLWGRRLYRYSISGNAWQRMSDTPGMIRSGSGITYHNGAVYIYQGYGGSLWKYTPPITTYKTNGTWYSPVYDNTYISAWGNFTVSDSGSNTRYWTRTSSNNNEWEDWQLVDGITINSSVNRYLQIRVDLFGDGATSPTVSSISVAYTGDDTGPNMTGISVIGKENKNSGVSIASGSAYVHTNPYFTWTGVTEDETTVSGYYVYWGTDDLDPVTNGNYQTNSDYNVNSSMVNGSTYKLRIAAKNSNGTTSSPATYFTYVYSGISPSTTVTVADTQDQWDNPQATKSAVYTSGSSWWNQSYAYRQQLTISSSVVASPGAMVKVTIDTDTLVSGNKLRSDRNDWRVLFWNGTYWKEVDRQYVNATSTYFPLQRGIAPGSSDNNYYVYYSNPAETTIAPSNLDNSRAHAKWGTGLSFDGNDQVQLPAGYTTAFNGKSAMTVEGWFLYNNSATNRWLYGRSAANNTSVGIIANSNYLTYNVTTTASTYNNAGTTYLESGKWYHFALAYDAISGTARGFVNGRLDYTRTSMSGNISAAATQMIGNYASVYHYGFLDEFRVSSSVRYTTDFTPSTTPFTTDANTIALYHFDDATGQSLTDSSGNGYNGTLGSAGGGDVNDPYWTYVGVASPAIEENAPVSPSNTSLTLEPMTEGSWAGYQLSSMPIGARGGYPASVVIGNEIYMLRGANSVAFYKQNVTTGVWTQLTDIPAAAYYGAAMVYDGSGAIYVSRGNAATSFYKYTIATNTWSSSIDQPAYAFSYGATMTKIGSKIYLFPGGNVTTFLSFDISYEGTSDGVDAWATLQSAPYTAYYGSGIVTDGNGTIWYVAGNGAGFAKYTIASDTWDTTVSAPALIPYPIAYSSNNAIYYNGYIYTFTSVDLQANGEAKNYIWRYKISTDKWENLQTTTEFWMNTGAVAYDGSRYAYFYNGYVGSLTGNTAVARYDLQNNVIFPETPPLPIDKNFVADSELIYHQAYTGTSMTYDNNDTVYFLQGSTGTNPANNYFNKYSISTKRWSQLPNPPCYTVGSIVYAQSKVYLVCANTTKKFYSFDPITVEWSMLTDAPDTINGAGTQIAAYDGSGAIYVLRGVGSTTLYKYAIGATPGSEWTTESASIPGTIGNSFGASITSDGSNYLYITRGSGTADFYRYKFTATKGWVKMTSVPETISYGSGSVLHNGKIYLTTGFFNSGMYIYDIVLDSWIKAPLTQSPVYAGGAMVKGSGDSLYVLQGYYMFTFWKYNISSATSSYKYSGSYQSRIIDLGTPYAIVGLSATVSSPSATTISFETRTSTDSANWDSWVTATDLKQNPSNQFVYHINSATNRYIQVKTSMTSDESATSPAVSDISIIYHQDSSAPTNPDTLLSYETSTKAASLSTNTWYNKANPYFEWSGATEASGSGILGYYVYFGQNSTANASTSGAFQTTASYSATLAQDGEYYLNIKTKDNAGNISTSNWSPFHYRYDGTAPNEIGTISVSPRIYSATNDFDMSWTAITDISSNSTSSGLLGYKYQASSSANFVNDIFTTTASLSGVLAYQEGVNNFSIRAEDIAGNTTTYKSASFYYNITPPSAPTNLEVVTTEADANKFSFTWDAPTTLKGSVKEYRYAINPVNNILNDSNISTVTATLITNQRGTRQGTNTFYVVAVDEAGIVDYANYASIDFEVDITAPGIPLNLESFDNSIRNTESYRVGLTWDKPTDMGSAFDRYEIYTSTDEVECSTSMDSFTLVGTTTGTSDGGSYVMTSINNEKLESVDYYLCVLACSSSNQCSGASTTVTMLPTGRWLVSPDLTAEPEAVVKTKTAIITWSTSRTANSFVKYGTGSGDYGDEVGSSDQVTAHEVKLENLAPGTTYYYKVLWTDEDGNQGESDEYTFVTNAAPSVSNVKITNVSLYSAYVTFTVNHATKATVQYGKTLSYGAIKSLSTSTTQTTQTAIIESLTEGTTYHLRIVAEDEESNTFAGDDYTFETLPVPKISGVRVQQVAGQASATIRLLWSSNTQISSIVTYYPTSNSGQAKDQISLTLKKSHEMILKNLIDDSEYSIIIKGKDIAGNEATAITQRVKTSVDLRAPELLNMQVESTIVGVGDEARAQIIVSWDTDELGTTQVEYAQGTGTTYGQSTQEDTNMTTNHVVTITGLTPSKIYHLRALSKDKSTNLGTSFDTVVITPKSTKDALNLVIDNLSKTFGFLKNIK